MSKYVLKRNRAIALLEDFRDEEDDTNFETLSNEELEEEVCLSGLFINLVGDLDEEYYEDDLVIED